MCKIRHIATSRKGSVFIAAEYEQKVYCYDLNSYRCISRFNTVLDFGGKRLAVSNDGTQCVAAAYHTHGIAMYDILTGCTIWERKDIKKTQFVTFDPSDEKLYIGISDKPMVIINSRNGCDDEKIRSTEKVRFDCSSPEKTLCQNRQTVKLLGSKIESPTFTFLDFIGIGTGAVLSAVGNDLMFYDYREQKITWRITPGKGWHFVQLAYSEKSNTVYAILYNYIGERTELYQLYGISASDGAIKVIFPLPDDAYEFGFAQDTSKLICSSGEIYELSCQEPKLAHLLFGT